jgi:FtsP/CotA-like multicopper oxidase with cupredoxin domain
MNRFSIWKLALFLVLASIGCLHAESPESKDGPAVKLFVREVPITVNGKTVKVVAIEQANGEQGYSPEMAKGFHAEVVNQLPVPTSIHWHGLVLPNLMDGVPYVTQLPIPPGGSQRYDFPLQQSGTYWMHSHYGMQEQQLTLAPMVIRSPAQAHRADAEFTVMLSDFSFTSPEDILKGLVNMTGMDMSGMDMAGPKVPLVVQQWDASSNRLVSKEIKDMAPDIDVKYDALLANCRTLDDPQVLAVKPGQTVLLRLIASSSATNYFIDTGGLDATILATDGEDVKPLQGNFFQLAIAQRLDLLVTIPAKGGAFPILALGEGTNLQSGVILATPGASVPKGLGIHGTRTMGGMDNTQEVRLVAAQPLVSKPVDNSLPSVLGGGMMPYKWTLNEKTYPNHDSLNVKEGQRVELVIKNTTGMSHPMHLHGHVFEVTEIDGQKITGAMRDTISVPPNSTIKVQFDANNPGVWPYHCHFLYHMMTGMFTVLKYDGADAKFWKPDDDMLEMENPLNLSGTAKDAPSHPMHSM